VVHQEKDVVQSSRPLSKLDDQYPTSVRPPTMFAEPGRGLQAGPLRRDREGCSASSRFHSGSVGPQTRRKKFERNPQLWSDKQSWINQKKDQNIIRPVSCNCLGGIWEAVTIPKDRSFAFASGVSNSWRLKAFRSSMRNCNRACSPRGNSFPTEKLSMSPECLSPGNPARACMRTEPPACTLLPSEGSRTQGQ
jgi:hypothetical protein